jgi:hypothetical protein
MATSEWRLANAAAASELSEFANPVALFATLDWPFAGESHG